MKLYKITAASEFGTKFYEIHKQDVLDVLDNVVLKEAFNEGGWKIFDISDLDGSKVIDGVLYLCKTDYQDIEIGGEWIAPEEALDFYTIEDLESYLEPATEDVIKHNLSQYEIRQIKINDVALNLLKDGVSFYDIVEAMTDLEIL